MSPDTPRAESAAAPAAPHVASAADDVPGAVKSSEIQAPRAMGLTVHDEEGINPVRQPFA